MILRWTAISSSTTAFFFFSSSCFPTLDSDFFLSLQSFENLVCAGRITPLLTFGAERNRVEHSSSFFFDTHKTIMLENNREKQLSLALLRDSDGFWAPSKMSSVRDLDANTLDSYFADQFASFALCQCTHIVRICFGTFFYDHHREL